MPEIAHRLDFEGYVGQSANLSPQTYLDYFVLYAIPFQIEDGDNVSLEEIQGCLRVDMFAGKVASTGCLGGY